MTFEQIAAAGGLYSECWTVRDEFAARFVIIEGMSQKNAYLCADKMLEEREREE